MLRLLSLLGAIATAGATRILSRPAVAPLAASGREGALGLVRALEFKHRLRVCNAYPLAAPLDILRGEHERLTEKEGPMRFETCRDFSASLQVGDKLEFKIGDTTTGTFAVSDLPSSDAVLLLVVHRHDQLSTAVSFESHVFSDMESSQVAVIDTYRGSAKGKPVITDTPPAAVKGHSPTAARREELRYSSVVAVSPGQYQVELDGPDGSRNASKPLVALPHESYVLLRTGIEAESGQSYPEDLVVFPMSEAKVVHSGAAAAQEASAIALLVAVAALL
mmetsp:Transcript_19903/g.52239  ORF Transcript_19903/g.52239 Transcript_19903/m.52239 type:complete len:278 (+) Transcript_19903:88-921(+)